VLNSVPRHEGVLESGGIAPRILNSTTDGGEWSALRPSRFTPWERAARTYWIGGILREEIGPRYERVPAGSG
jgi:hypothetical protein